MANRINKCAERLLTDSILRVDAQLRPRAAQHALKRALLQVLTPLLQGRLGGSLETFGSCSNGFWVRGSDVDACLLLPGVSHKAEQLTKLRVVKSLVERLGLATAEVIKAQVPIAKLKGVDGESLLDLSVCNAAALENSALVRVFGQLDPRIPPLGRFIKHWATLRRINNRAEGTLSTYTLMLQLFFFLQTTEPPILPAFRDFARGDVTPLKRASLSLTDSLAGQGERPLPFESNCEAIRNGPMAAFPRNTESLGSLLRGFFQFYGSTLQNLSLSQDLPVEIDLFDASLRLGKQRLDVASLQRLRFHGRRRTKACQDEGGAALSLCRLPSCASLRTLPSGFSLQPESAEPPALVVRCPLTRCVVNRFSASAWRAIAEEFRRAERILAAQLPLECTYDRDGALPHRQRSRESGFRDKSL